VFTAGLGISLQRGGGGRIPGKEGESLSNPTLVTDPERGVTVALVTDPETDIAVALMIGPETDVAVGLVTGPEGDVTVGLVTDPETDVAVGLVTDPEKDVAVGLMTGQEGDVVVALVTGGYGADHRRGVGPHQEITPGRGAEGIWNGPAKGEIDQGPEMEELGRDPETGGEGPNASISWSPIFALLHLLHVHYDYSLSMIVVLLL